MLLHESSRPGLVVRGCSLSSRRFPAGARGRVRDDELPRLASNALGPSLDETHDGVEDVGRGVDVATMEAHLGAPEADHHTSVFRERERRDGLQAPAAKKLEECGFDLRLGGFVKSISLAALGMTTRVRMTGRLRRMREDVELRGIVHVPAAE